ncbi:hypothetical protein K8I31_09430 [bacterium]|nr:hypothetical protein [bacterium]
MDNNQPSLFRIFTLTVLSGVACCACLVSCQHAAPPDKPLPAVEPLSFKPIDYFEFNCARCHGSYGSSYGDTFGEGMTDEELVEFVDDMAGGPGQAPIEGKKLDAEVAFHRSLVLDEPFIAWTGWDGKTLSGEVTAEATVSIQIGDKQYQAKVKDEQWTLDVAIPSTHLGNVIIIAKLDNKICRLQISERSFSHYTPLN